MCAIQQVQPNLSKMDSLVLRDVDHTHGKQKLSYESLVHLKHPILLPHFDPQSRIDLQKCLIACVFETMTPTLSN